MLLQNKTAFVTGGSRGIGYAIVERFLQEGANVYYYSRNPSELHDELETLAQSNNVMLKYMQGSVSDEETVRSAIQTAKQESGQIDILVNNAGITRDKLFVGMKKDDWDSVIETNLTSVFYASHAITPIMLKQRSGVIINISSVVGISGNPGQANYCASKAGIIGFSKSLALELAKRNVRVNVIAPGFIGTDMTDSIAEEYQEKLLEQIPMKRIGMPKEIGDACVFLGSELSTYITGQVLIVSGGLA